MSLIKTLLAALALAGASLAAQADTVMRFHGSTDSGSLAGASIDGEFSFAEQAADFDGWTLLKSFQMNAFGQVYTLADADTPALAWFALGTFLGVDYQSSTSADPALRPWVTLLAGFFDASEAYLAYDATGAGTEGFGSLSFEAVQAVPEPSAAALLLAGLLAAGTLRRRR